MAESKKKAVAEQPDDDWEQVEASQPDDTISILSESETIANDQSYVEVDHPKKTTYSGRLFQHTKDWPQGPLPTLRTSLYALKDTLKESIEQLNDFADYASLQALAISAPLAVAQQRQVDALNMLLTNCASDWDVSANSGGMTFDEFADLDPVSVDELNRIFGEFVNDVRLQKYARRPVAGEGSEEEEKDEDKDKDEDEDEDEAKDVGFLDFILPAVHEVDTLLRVPPDSEGFKMFQEQDEDAKTLKAKDEDSAPQDESDEKVHEQMMMVSDW